MRVTERWTRRLWIAGAGALALHGLVLLALLLLPSPEVKGRRPPVKALQVDLRKVAPAGAPPSSEVPESGHVRGGSTARKAAPPAGEAQPSSAETSAGDEPAAWSRDWRIGEGIDRSGGEVSLRLEHPEGVRGPGAGTERDGSAGLVREKSREEKLAEEQATVERRIEGWLSEAKAKERAQTRDGYWQAVEDALGHGFNPGWDVLEHGPSETPNSTVGALVEAWKKQAAAYGRSGNPFAGLPDAPGARKPLPEEFLELANEDRGLRTLSLGPTLNLGMLRAAAAASGKTWHFQAGRLRARHPARGRIPLRRRAARHQRQRRLRPPRARASALAGRAAARASAARPRDALGIRDGVLPDPAVAHRGLRARRLHPEELLVPAAEARALARALAGHLLGLRSRTSCPPRTPGCWCR